MYLVFHYVCCDNNLSNLVFRDFAKITNFTKPPKNCIFYCLYNAKEYGNYLIEIGPSHLVHNNILITRIHEEIDMSNINTLDKFISGGKHKYKADKYAFIYGGHGDNFYITPEEKTYISLDNFLIPILKKNHIELELLILDCCLMSSLECFSEINDNSIHYTIGCEHWGLNSGFISDNIIKKFDENISTIKLGEILIDECDKYIDNSDEINEIYSAVMINNKNIQNMLDNLDKVKIDKYIPYEEIRKHCGIDQRDNKEADVSYLDLHEFVKLSMNNSETILKSIQDVVVYIRTNNIGDTKVNGINFCPSTELYTDYRSKYYELSIPYNRYLWLRDLHRSYDKEISEMKKDKKKTKFKNIIICSCVGMALTHALVRH